MKSIKLSISIIASVFAISSCNQTVTVGDFETGDYNGWSVEGEAFGLAPTEFTGDSQLTGNEGQYYASGKGDGKLISKEFVIDKNYINLLMAGPSFPAAGRAVLYVGDDSVMVAAPVGENRSQMEWVSWDVKDYKNKTAHIEFVTRSMARGRMSGTMAVDQVEMGNAKKSIFIEKFIKNLKVSDRYLIVPCEDMASNKKVAITIDGEEVFSTNIRLAQDKVDYYVPIDLKEYSGKEIGIMINKVKETSIGINSLTLAPEFTFEYDEPYRLGYHFTPHYCWINDPNGMVYYDGEYHLFYQYNPYGTRHANMHWGHSVSKDLLTWEHLPVALAPDELGSIFSGSSVIDVNNTAGFGENAMVAIYTSAGRSQQQSIAYSTDKGRTFTTYSGNPVIANTNIRDFRDPKVYWFDEFGKWIMSLATGQTISFYESDNLREWNFLSSFGEGLGSHAGVWECPDLFKLDYNGETKWILFVSLGGGPNGGSATQYFIGDFDGKTFKADKRDYPLWVDYGTDNYAGVLFSNLDKPIFMGWMSNWDYTNDVPSVNFRNGMTLPREMKLVSDGKLPILASVPVEELKNLRKESVTIEDFTITDNTRQIDIAPEADGMFELEMKANSSINGLYGFRLVNIAGEHVDFKFNIGEGHSVVDRSESGLVDFNPRFSNSAIKAPIGKDQSQDIRLFVDKASAEMFINNGKYVQTVTFFPTEPFDRVIFFCEKGQVEISGLTVHTIR